ncbi:3-isopropylmalate dehydratase small subunit [Pigmentiphaga soli]|uniref:3-isopropylmalate dehydratase small subunit n=1 Tax=Pigmentiphaga soli TaxID=1007095 RepID=A0ABP8H021_9BURK
MQPFTTLTAVAAPLDMANIDTDKIIPARFLRKHRGDPGYADLAFHDIRFDADGAERPEFVLNQAPYRAAQVLVAGANFGCGSSREAAVYVLADRGIRSVIAPSFGDIHYANELQNGMLPVILPEDDCQALRRELHERPGAAVAIDLPAQTVTAPSGRSWRFEIDPAYKERLLKGLDDIGLVMQHIGAIEAFEARRHADMPWLA